MQEALIQYVWKNSLFKKELYYSDTKEHIRIISSGVQNNDGGPDFTDARIEIEGTLWAGNVEIHKRASEWYDHGHHTDPAYNNVILHVVIEADKNCFTNSGRQIACIELQFNKKIESRYLQLVGNKNKIPCSDSLGNLNPSHISFWLNTLTIERLQSKTSHIQNLLNFTRNNWEEAFYILIAYNFGLTVNALPFELLAKSVSLKIRSNHTNSLTELEALYFGQAGFLDAEPVDNYQQRLLNEYEYMKKKYHLHPLEKHLWKFLRLRPTNFPTIRIAQFCSLINKTGNLFSKIMECFQPGQLFELFCCSASEYWTNHYQFGKITKSSEKKMGSTMISSIIINTVIPFLFIYGEKKNKDYLKDNAIRFLESMPSENNYIIRKWKDYNVQSRNASESQAIIQLTTQYCDQKRCLECQIGYLILKA